MACSDGISMERNHASPPRFLKAKASVRTNLFKLISSGQIPLGPRTTTLMSRFCFMPSKRPREGRARFARRLHGIVGSLAHPRDAYRLSRTTMTKTCHSPGSYSLVGMSDNVVFTRESRQVTMYFRGSASVKRASAVRCQGVLSSMASP